MTLVVVTGVGTEIGKTHVAAGLVAAWGREAAVLGYKPIESGVVGDAGSDEALLRSVSTFHVKHPPVQFRLRAAVSPHLAARAEARAVPFAEIVADVSRLRADTAVVVELPGGLFSPLTDTTCNADLALALAPDVILLIAPDRLGVLHEVRAGYEACRARGLPLDGVVLSAPATPDLSTSTNAEELARTSGLPVLASFPRASRESLVASGAFDDLVRACRRGPLKHELAPLK